MKRTSRRTCRAGEQRDAPDDQDRDVADEDQQRRPQREHVADHERDQAGGDRQPVGHRVEDLAQLRDLVRSLRAIVPSTQSVATTSPNRISRRGGVAVDDQRDEHRDQQRCGRTR